MKALIISDVHSNIEALEAILAQEKKWDAIFCAGDLVDIGPHPNEVVDWMIQHQVQCVRGNHDELIAQLYESTEKRPRPADQKLTWAQYNASIITPKSIAYLKSLPERLIFDWGGHRYCMQHLYHEYDTILSKFQFRNYQRSIGIEETTRLVFGHTHRQCVVSFSETLLMLNPGSASYRTYLEPEDHSTAAEYAILQDELISFRSIEYDKSKTYRLVEGLQNTLIEKDYLRALRRFSPSS